MEKILGFLLISFMTILASNPCEIAATEIPQLVPQVGHSESINAIAFSPNGRMIISGGRDLGIKIWEPDSGRINRTIRGHKGEIFALAFSPDGKMFASGGKDGALHLWQSETGELLKVLKQDQIVTAIAFTQDGKYVAVAGNKKEIKIWNVSTGSILMKIEGVDTRFGSGKKGNGHWFEISSLAFSPDGNLLASGSWDHSIKLWDPKSGELIKTFKGHHEWVTDVEFSLDGTRLFSSSYDKRIIVRDIRSGKIKRIFLQSGAVLCLALSKDGKTLISGSENGILKLTEVGSGKFKILHRGPYPITAVSYHPKKKMIAAAQGDDVFSTVTGGWDRGNSILLFDTDKNTILQELKGRSSFVGSLAVAPNSSTMFSSSGDHTIKVWDLKTGTMSRVLKGHSSAVQPLSMSSDGSKLASGSPDKSIIIWDLNSGTPINTLFGHKTDVLGLRFLSDNNTLVSGSTDSTVRIWDSKNGDQIRLIKTSTSSHQPDLFPIIALDFSPDGSRVALGGLENPLSLSNLVLWDFSGDAFNEDLGVRYPVSDVAFSPSGALLATAGQDPKGEKGLLVIWEVGTGSLFMQLEHGAKNVASVRFSPKDNYIAASGDNGGIKMWDIGSGKLLWSVTGHVGTVMDLEFSPNGQLLFSGGKDATVKIWEASTGTLLSTFHDHSKDVMDLSVSPDGKFLASVGWDEKVMLWDIPSRKLHHSMEGHTDRILCVSFSPKGDLLATAGADSKVLLWDFVKGDRVKSFDGHRGDIMDVDFSPDGTLLVSGSLDRTAKVWNITTGKIQETLYKKLPHPVFQLGISPQEDFVATGSLWWAQMGIQKIGAPEQIKLWDLKSGELLKDIVKDSMFPGNFIFSSDNESLIYLGSKGEVFSKNLENLSQEPIKVIESPGIGTNLKTLNQDKWLLGSDETSIKVWDYENRRQLYTLEGHVAGVTDVIDIPETEIIASGSRDTTIKFWNKRTGKLLATAMAIEEKDWLVFSPEGYFDGSRLAWQLVPFIFPSNPKALYEPEQFFNQFFQPALLHDVIKSGYSIQKILKDKGSSRAKLNILQYKNSHLPEVLIKTAIPSKPIPLREFEIDFEVRDTGSGIRDCRIFRNQTLVHFQHGELPSDPLIGVFRPREIPKVKIVEGLNEIRIYCFNRDDIKSKDAVIKIFGDNSLKRSGKAYILSVGVNEYPFPGLNLKYAVPDAKLVSNALGEKLESLEKYSDVVRLELTDRQATRVNIKRLLNRLGGDTSPFPTGLPFEAEGIQPAEPEDLVVVYFAGHGTAQEDRYYLIPSLIKQNSASSLSRASKTELLLQQSLSDQDFQKSFEDLDAGTIIFIIDACESGQVLESEEQRRGPLNSRGLVQLAYEKGMYVLAAAQAYESAVELEKLGHGLLTHVLVREGLENMLADRNPRDGKLTIQEWLNYAVQEVPNEYEKTQTRRLQALGRPIIFDKGRERIGGQIPRAYYPREMLAQKPLIGIDGKLSKDIERNNNNMTREIPLIESVGASDNDLKDDKNLQNDPPPTIKFEIAFTMPIAKVSKFEMVFAPESYFRPRATSCTIGRMYIDGKFLANYIEKPWKKSTSLFGNSYLNNIPSGQYSGHLKFMKNQKEWQVEINGKQGEALYQFYLSKIPEHLEGVLQIGDVIRADKGCQIKGASSAHGRLKSVFEAFQNESQLSYAPVTIEIDYDRTAEAFFHKKILYINNGDKWDTYGKGKFLDSIPEVQRDLEWIYLGLPKSLQMAVKKKQPTASNLDRAFVRSSLTSRKVQLREKLEDPWRDFGMLEVLK